MEEFKNKIFEHNKIFYDEIYEIDEQIKQLKQKQKQKYELINDNKQKLSHFCIQTNGKHKFVLQRKNHHYENNEYKCEFCETELDF